jgi:hypothetical protein
MANNLGSLVVSLGLDAAEFTRGMSKGEYQAKQSVDRIKGEFDGLAKYVAGLGIGAALVQSVRNTADYADELGKLAQKAGTSTEEVSKLAYAARQADVDNEQLAKGLRALGEDAQSGGKKLAELGISVTDASGKTKSSADLFRELATVIAGIEDPQRKAAVAAELLGEKLGPGLIPLLNQGASGLKDMADEAARFGRLVTDEAAKAAEQFNDNLTKLNEASAGLAASIGNAVIPALNNLITEFNTGIKAAGGFWNALSLSTINPFRDAAGNIKVLRDELTGLQGDRARYIKAGSETSGIDAAIKSTETKLNYLTALERQAQAARVVYSADDQGLAEAKRLGLAPPTAVPAPKPGKVGTSGAKSKTSTGKDPVLEANEREAAMQKLLIDLEFKRIDQSRKGDIEELNAIEERNTAYQKWVQSLIDDTPTQQLAKQQQAMIDLAAEYERGTFGAAGSAEAIALYGETVNTYLGNLKAGAEQINASAAAAGSIFGSWLEAAITDGAKLSDVINGLINDLVRLAIQKSVIEPAAAGFSTFVGGLIGGTASFDGGGYTGNGARSGGVDGKGGFPAILHPNETVIDHTKGQSMGGNVSVTYTIDARGADPGSEMRIRQAIKESEARTKADILSSMNKGGTFARASGRA